MSTTTAATAVAPQITGKDVAVLTVKNTTKYAHIGLTAMADVVMYAGAHLVKAIDKTQTVQDTVDEVQANTSNKLASMRQKLSGYKKAE